MEGDVSLRWWRARCRCCQWESKDCASNFEALKAFNKHAAKHLSIEPVERKVESDLAELGGK